MKKNTQANLESQLDETVKHLIESSDKNHTSYLDHIRKTAHTLAYARLPKLNDSIYGYIEEFIGYYEKERTNVLVSLNANIQSMRTKIGMSEPMKQIAEKEKEIENHKRVLNNKNDDRNSFKMMRDVWLHKFYNIILWIITFLECCWLALVFSGAFNDSNILVVIGAFVLSFFLIQGTKITTLYFRDKKEKASLWVKILVPTLIGLVVVSLGLVRFSSVVVTSDETITTYKYMSNPLIFIVLTMIPILGTALIVWKYILSDEELKQLRDCERLDKECKAEKERLDICKNELNILTAHRNDIANTGVKGKHAEQVLIKRFDGYMKEALGIFKLENIKHRDDSVYPICFTQSSPTLSSVEINSFDNQENQLS